MNQVQFYRWLVIINGGVPLLMLAWDTYRGNLGANPTSSALHVTGMLSLIFLLLSLLITPLKTWTGWGGWIAFRRSLGLYGFFYALLHAAIYVVFDRALDLSSTLSEFATRRYLQVGGTAVLMMVPLAVTSTNNMLKRMGAKNWKKLHRLAYVVAILGVVHFYMLVKSDVREPLMYGACLAGLLGVRLIKTKPARRGAKSLPADQAN